MEKQEKSERKNLNKEKKIIMKRNTKGITLIALVVTTIFFYDEMLKFSNNKGFLLKTI